MSNITTHDELRPSFILHTNLSQGEGPHDGVLYPLVLQAVVLCFGS